MRVRDEMTEGPEEPRKRSRFAPMTSRQCPDWMVISGNCHYARDQASFITYRPVARQIKNNIFNPYDEIHVAGVGTVHLTVCKSPHDLSPHTIVLENVLHIPEAVCNGFNPLLYGSSMSCHQEYWEGGDTSGNPIWFSAPFAGGTKLVLAGDPPGESEMIQGRDYTLCLSVSPEEWKSILVEGHEQDQGNAMEG